MSFSGLFMFMIMSLMFMVMPFVIVVVSFFMFVGFMFMLSMCRSIAIATCQDVGENRPRSIYSFQYDVLVLIYVLWLTAGLGFMIYIINT